MKQPWHNRNNRKGGRHRKPRHTNKHRKAQSKSQSRTEVVFKEPTAAAYTSSATGKYKSRFRADGKPGTRPEAVILDMDGTLEDWDGYPNDHAMEYAREHHAQGRVLIIVTARDHKWSYKRTHDWLRKHLDLPFVGPICRPADDQRYACDFKKHVYDQLSVVYDIVSAIDDDHYVLSMWRSIPGLDVVATSYSSRPSSRWSGYYGSSTGYTPVTSYGVTRSQSYYDDFHWGADDIAVLDAPTTPDEDLADEYEWVKWEEELLAAKRNKKDRRPWESDADAGMDIYCHHCDHPWFDHDILGCNFTDFCQCAG